MNNKLTIAALLVDDAATITWVEVCQQYQISEQDLQEMLEHGLLKGDDFSIEEAVFDSQNLQRIASACRLQHDLDLNMPGVVLALELLDELKRLRKELAILQRLTD